MGLGPFRGPFLCRRASISTSVAEVVGLGRRGRSTGRSRAMPLL